MLNCGASIIVCIDFRSEDVFTRMADSYVGQGSGEVSPDASIDIHCLLAFLFAPSCKFWHVEFRSILISCRAVVHNLIGACDA